MFQLKFAIITPALITGSFAERVRFSAYLRVHGACSACSSTARSRTGRGIREGFLRQWGVLDFAGGTVVHMSAGLRGAGRRDRARPAPDRIADGGAHVAGEHPVRAARHRHAVVRLVRLQRRLGARGERARRPWRSPPRNTASAAAMLGWILFDVARGRRPSALGACIGAVVGLVAITPAAGYVSIAHEHLHRLRRERRQQPRRALEVASRRSTTRSTCSPATASAASSACC